MREIKFRGRRIDNREWCYGYLYIHNGYSGTSALIRGDKILDTEVDIKTIGQYTGLKDQNGIEIYEGDIIECTGDIYTIVWNEVAFKLLCDNDLINQLDDIADISEVIGNIYENKELLKKEGK